MYEKIYGLSCIENHVLAILRQRGEDISWTYYDSAVPLYQLYNEMVRNGVKQESFNSVKRVHDTLRKMGIISLKRIEPLNIMDTARVINSCRDNEYILIRVSSEFAQKVLHTRERQPDHYVLAKAADDGWTVSIDIPPYVIAITEEQFCTVFDGDCFVLTVNRQIDTADTRSLWCKRTHKPEKHRRTYFTQDDLFGIEEPKIRLRDMACVYALLRRRMAEYYGRYVNTEFFNRLLPEIERTRDAFAAHSKQKNTPVGKYAELLRELSNIDAFLINTLNKRLENVK